MRHLAPALLLALIPLAAGSPLVLDGIHNDLATEYQVELVPFIITDGQLVAYEPESFTIPPASTLPGVSLACATPYAGSLAQSVNATHARALVPCWGTGTVQVYELEGQVIVN